MAEALSRKKLGSKVQVMSAGLEPQPAADAKTAIDTLSTYFDIDASGHVPRSRGAEQVPEKLANRSGKGQ